MTRQLAMDNEIARTDRTGHPRFDRLLDKLDAAWTAFHESCAGLDDERLLVAGVTGAWSVRDLIAHVAWWDAEATAHLPLILEGGTPPRYSPTTP